MLGAMLAKNPCEDVFDVFCPLVRKCHDDCGLAFLLFLAWCEEQTEVCFLRVIALVQFLDPQFCWREVLYSSDFLIAVPSSTTPRGLPRLGVPSHLDVCLFTQTVPLGDTTIFDTHTLLGRRSPRPTKPQGIHSFSSLCYTTLVPLGLLHLPPCCCKITSIPRLVTPQDLTWHQFTRLWRAPVTTTTTTHPTARL